MELPTTWVLSELAEIVVRPLSTVFGKSWQTDKVSVNWREANLTPVFKKGKKQDPRNYRSISLTSLPGKVMD